MSCVELAEARPGDLVFCHSAGIVGGAIRLAESFRRDWDDDHLASEQPGDEWNHVAVLSSCVGASHNPFNWWVIQAEGRGVTESLLGDVAPDGRYEIVRLPTGCEPARVLAFMRLALGDRYGFVTIASIVATLLSPRFFNVMAPGTWICSAVAAEALRFAGWLHDWPDIYQVSPAELWMAI